MSPVAINGINSLQIARLRQLFTLDFWSPPEEEVAVTTPAGTLALPSVSVIGLPVGATIVRAIVMFKFRMIENINAGAGYTNMSILMKLLAPDLTRLRGDVLPFPLVLARLS